MKFPNLMSPLTIRGHHYRNRILCAPTMFAHAVFVCKGYSENVYRMVEDRARGGAAEVSTGEICVNFEEGITSFIENPIDFDRREGSDFEAFCEYARRIKRHGAVALLEFCHEGLEAPVVPPYEPWGPDDMIRPDGIHVHAMDELMMEKVCADFERIGRFAIACGFDGTLLHGGHGFLLQQFVSPLTNHRTDEYGGSPENRARFPKRLIHALRRGMGENAILELRFSATDGLGTPDDMTIEDSLAFAEQIDGLVDIFHVSNGHKHKGNASGTFSSHFDPHGVNIEYARRFRQVLKKSYVGVVGGINSPEQCEEILSSGAADFVILGRQCFTDPEFANKVRDGKEDTIRRCVRCCDCYPGVPEHPTDPALTFPPEFFLKNFSPAACPPGLARCSLNPDSGIRRVPFDTLPPCEKKKVLVVGGGPAGMQAAITAADRGHEVHLAEAGSTLGGTVNIYRNDPHKADIKGFIELLAREATGKATVETNTVVDEEYIRCADFDELIIAVGAAQRIPELPGIEHTADILRIYTEMPQGKNILIAGAGITACESAILLAEHGNRVRLVLRGDVVAKMLLGIGRNALLSKMEQCGIQFVMGVQCTEFTSGALVGTDTQGNRICLEADMVYRAFGSVSRSKLASQLGNACGGRPYYMVGDCTAPGRIGDAIHGGYQAATKIGL